jgi:lambda repressor-like predicted transcriptional regulator
MHPEQIKAAIRMKGTTQAVVAEKLEVSRSTVSHVVNGHGTSARIKAHIAKVTGLPVSTLWPAKKSLRRAKPELDKCGFPVNATLIGAKPAKAGK